MYSGYGTTFGSAGSWNFDNDFSRNVVIIGVANSSSYHTTRINNLQNNFLVLGESPNSGINGSFGSPEQEFSI